MPWNLDDSRPLYQQLAAKIQSDIVSGVYLPGQKLPSVRDLAAEAAVNPNTMQKALADLEQDGLLYTQRTSGRFISDDPHVIRELKDRLARERLREFILSMEQLGFSDLEIKQYFNEVTKEERA